MEDRINSNESEGAFNDFVNDRLKDMLDSIINEGDLSERGSEIVVEIDDITPPTFTYGDHAGGAGGGGDQGPGRDRGRISFSLPFDSLMSLIAERLRLPDLTKLGDGRIKEVSYEFKTFGTTGVLLDKKRTFKRALRSSIGTGVYRPDDGVFDVEFHRRDRRYKIPERVEKPRFRAVVFYMGDISYSTTGERLELEKRLVNFIENWLNYNYGKGNVDHRFFVHDVEAHEVLPEDFYRVETSGGTMASSVFELVHQVATNEYDPQSTNYYAFYFGDGEIFEDDAARILEVIQNQLRPLFNRIGVVEVKPSRFSQLKRRIGERYDRDVVVKLGELNQKSATIEVIKALFGPGRAEDALAI